MGVEQLQRLRDELSAERERLHGVEQSAARAEDFCARMQAEGAIVETRREGRWGFHVRVSHPGGGEQGERPESRPEIVPLAEPEPDAPPAPEAGPAAEDPAAPQETKSTRGVPWSPEEDAEARRILAAGGSSKDVARKLGRTDRSAEQRSSKLRREMDEERGEKLEKPAPRGAAAPRREAAPAASQPHPEPAEEAAAPAVATPVPRVAQEPAVPGPEKPSDDRPQNYPAAPPLGASLRKRPPASDSFWTPERDLVLVQTLSSGGKLAGAARKIGCNLDAAKARWRHLIPNPTWDAQVKLLAQLREQVAQ